MINRFQKRGYDRSLIEQQVNKANLQERKQLLKEKKKETPTNIPLSLKYNRTLPGTLLVPNQLKTAESKGNLQTKYKVNVRHA